MAKDHIDMRELEKLTRQIEEQNILIKELTLIQEVLSTTCHVSSYQISLFEAVRNPDGEVTGLKPQKLELNSNGIKIEANKSIKTDEMDKPVIRLLNQSSGISSSEYEFSTEDKHGKRRWFLNKLTVFKRTEGGLPQQVIAITQDITEKKSQELLSLEQQQIIASVTDASPDILFILNLPHLDITYVNKAVNDIFHYNGGQIIKMGGAFMEDHTHPEDKEKVMEYFHCVSTQKDFPLKELHYRMKDALGEWHNIRCRHSVFKTNRDGIPIQLIGVKQDITEYKRVQDKRIRKKIKRQQELSTAILRTQEEERKRIAEGLHNSLGQVLYVAKLKLDMLDADLSDPLKNNQELKASICELIDSAIKETRTISFELMPATLEDFGLDTAIKDILRNKLGKSGIKYSVLISGLKSRLAADIEIAIFRIVQELINNLIKHSQATKAEVNVRRGADFIIIKVKDNGKGFSQEKEFAAGKGFGLRSIVNRVKFLNGKISFDPAQTTGSVITVDIPL